MSHASKSSPRSYNDGEEVFALIIRRSPPEHVFPDEWFDIEIGLGVTEGITSSLESKYDVEVTATLHDFISGSLFQDGTALTMEPSKFQLSTESSDNNPFQTAKCKISTRDTGSDEHAPELSIRFTTGVWSPEVPDHVTIPLQLNTSSISIAAYKLKIRTDDEWDDVWYKDEGGREKCMTANVGLYDKEYRREKGKKIPLAVSLFYSHPSGIPVQAKQQNALRVMDASKRSIDKKTGTASVKFRIDEVSKNHQGQDFVIRISAETDKYKLNNVASVFTTPVTVKSKRYKRPMASSSPQLMTAGPPGQPTPLMPAPVDQNWVPPVLVPPPINQQHQHQHQGPPQTSLPLQSSVPSTGQHHAQVSPPEPPGAEIHRLQQALHRVRSWTDEVVNALRPMQWQVIGYAQNPDGTSDFNRPYYNMNNPNNSITRLLGIHAESVKDDLQKLESAVSLTENVTGHHAPSVQPRRPYYPGYA
mmetsp:Transcript_8757/g.12393  ORF Transcript_8757/g.12393 Transcript_8757/m.12393 type:complete len:474 (+) Transcript_8757:715-2136(+)